MLSYHIQSWPFREPVNKEDVADYYEIIKDPIGNLTRFFVYLQNWKLKI